MQKELWVASNISSIMDHNEHYKYAIYFKIVISDSNNYSSLVNSIWNSRVILLSLKFTRKISQKLIINYDYIYFWTGFHQSLKKLDESLRGITVSLETRETVKTP